MGFLGSALEGYADQATKMKKDKQRGILRKKKKAKDTQDGKPQGYAEPFSFKRGGRVKKSGMAKVHKGEVVLTKRQARKRKKGSKKRR